MTETVRSADGTTIARRGRRRHAPEPAWVRFEALAPTLAYDTRIMGATTRGDPEPLRQWATVTTPTLVIGGTETFPFLHASADALAGVLPDAERITLEGQDHGPAPEVLAPVLVEFFGR